LIQNDVGRNAYGDWPESGEVIGCLPRITETEWVCHFSQPYWDIWKWDINNSFCHLPSLSK